MLRKPGKYVNTGKGFTLIELMVVVAITSILAAIAIPNFLQYQLKSRTSEVKVNIGAIKTSQISYKAEFDVFVTLVASPNNNPGISKQAWVDVNNKFGEIGFSPSGNVYYCYEGQTAADANGNIGGEMCIGAFGDLDGDNANGEFLFATRLASVATTTNILGVATIANVVQDIAAGQY